MVFRNSSSSYGGGGYGGMMRLINDVKEQYIFTGVPSSEMLMSIFV